MNEKKLPIKLVMQNASDLKKNHGGGSPTFFGELTPEIQSSISQKFQDILEFYDDIFKENELIPAVGKIVVKPEAIAKSHKPNNLCRKCSIIGSENLDEIYIKVSKKSIEDTIKLVNNPPSNNFRANLTAISDIKPITINDKISDDITRINAQGNFGSIKNKIKLKIFDFGDEFDDHQILNYVMQKLSQYGFTDKHEIISYGVKIKFIKVEVSSYDDIIKIASINGIKKIDFFQEYSLPKSELTQTGLIKFLDDENSDCETIIGIIDGGISDENPFIKPYIIARESYVPLIYQNLNHATFIASTILYGNKLNGIEAPNNKAFKLVDIIAIPNSLPSFGPTDSISEHQLMHIIEEVMQKYSSRVKIWNLSLGIEDNICCDSMSDLGLFLDYIQDTYQVQMFVSSGNLNIPPFRKWPAQPDMGDRDRTISPADSVRAITVGSIALYESENSIVKMNQPSPFSRRGPGANYIVKPDVVDYGGNISMSHTIEGLGMKGLDTQGNVIEGIGTSYSNPRVLQKFAYIYDEMVQKDLLLAKAMIIHSARMQSRELLDNNRDSIKYYGFGMPIANVKEILYCSENEVTLVFRQKVPKGLHLEMYDFPYPKSLIKDGKYYGEITMTLAYIPTLDSRFGKEYCRTNVEVSFGTYKYIEKEKKYDFQGKVPLECAWDEKFESSRVESGFKWSPIKSYYRKICNGINVTDGWKINISMSPRNEFEVFEQEFVLIITIKDPEGHDIYSEVVNGLREKGYITNNLETKQQIRQRQ